MLGKLVTVFLGLEYEHIVCVVDGKFGCTELHYAFGEANGILLAPKGPLSGKTAFTNSVSFWIKTIL